MRSERTLILLKQRFMGDAILATPLIKAIAKERPHTFLYAAPSIAEVLKEDLGGIEVVAPGPKGGLKSIWTEAARLRQMRFGTIVLVNRSFRSAMIARLAGIPERIGYSTEGRSILLTKKVAYHEEKPEIDCYADLGRAMGLEADYAHVKLTVSEAESSKGKELLAGAKVGVQPGARWETRALPTPVAAEVVNAVTSRGQRVALFGGPEERPYSDKLGPLLKQAPVDLVGKSSLRETMGALSNLETLIAADSGLVHIAVALGIPTVAIFGPSPSAKWGHFYPPHRVIQISSGNMADASSAEILEAFSRY